MQHENVTPLTECVACSSNTHLQPVFNLGNRTLANEYLDTPNPNQASYPLAINVCTNCWHVQLSHVVNPAILFSNYAYMSGISATMRNYYSWFAKETLDFFPKAKTVLEIACNDGSQLDVYKTLGVVTYGVDAAQNMVDIADKKGHSITCDFFPNKERLAMMPKDIIVAQNVFAHVADPYTFLLGCKDIMHDQSVLFIQTSQVDMIKDNQFDTIYHEHISFFSVNSMNTLVQRAGLILSKVIRTPVHGGSYIFVISKTMAQHQSVNTFLKEEKPLHTLLPYQKFELNSNKFRKNFLESVKQACRGKRLIGYGASAKGVNLLAFTGIVPEFIIDDTPTKQGKFISGTNILICTSAAIKNLPKKNVVFIPLAWNFYEEIKSKIENLRDFNPDDTFIKFFPHIMVEKAI